jgi:hypothetical protein
MGRTNRLLSFDSESKSQSYFTAAGSLPISSSLRQAPWDSQPAFLFQLNTCRHCPYVTSSLTRRWVCRLQLSLALANAVVLMSESRRSHDQILLPQIRDSLNLEGQVPIFMSPRNRVTQLYFQALGFPFPRLIRPAELRWKYSTPLPPGGLWSSELFYDWRFTANQCVLASSPLRLTTQ